MYLTPGLAAASVTDAIEENDEETAETESEEIEKKEEKLELVPSSSAVSKKSKNKWKLNCYQIKFLMWYLS